MKKMSKLLCVGTLLATPLTTSVDRVFASEQGNTTIDSSFMEESTMDSTQADSSTTDSSTTDSSTTDSTTTNDTTDVATDESTTTTDSSQENIDKEETGTSDSTQVPEEPVIPDQENQSNSTGFVPGNGGTTNIEKPVFNVPTSPTIRKPDLSQFSYSITVSETQPKQPKQTNRLAIKKNETIESFIQKIGEDARNVAQENDLYASVILAQAILETGAGSSTLSQAPYYNLFGIKGTFNSQGVYLATQEDNGYGQLSTILAQFRKYSGYEESFQDYAKLMKKGITGNQEFYRGTWKSNASTYKEATQALTGTYATDIYYGEKLNNLIETYDLTQYDEARERVISETNYMMPLDSYTVTSEFGLRGSEFHRGIDLAAPSGTPIKAAKSGKVIVADTHYSWGNYVVIEHEDGTTMLYAHQEKYIVNVGQQVGQGSLIGFVGSTGNSTGPHLHLELCTDNTSLKTKLQNPRIVLPMD